MNKISRILMMVLILFAIVQMASASNAQDYTCIDKVDSKSIPPTSSFIGIEKNVEKVPLCPEGKVPQATTIGVIQDNDGAGDIMKYINKSEVISGNIRSSEMASCSNGKCYDWAYSIQFVDNIGIAAYMTQHSPEIDPTNGLRSRARIHIGGGTNDENRVEFGWAKERGGVTRLYTAWWRYGLWQCDNNNCGDWVQTSNSYYPGMPTSMDGSANFYEIQYSNGDWWIGLNGEWMGYYIGNLWDNQFDIADTIMYSGGVTSKTPVSTTDMGNGLWASDPYAARIYAQHYTDPNGDPKEAHTMKSATSPNLYTVMSTSSDSMRYGGPGIVSGIRLVSPNGGENWARGTTKLITWTKTGNPGTSINIELLKNGILNKVISWSTPNDGSYSWPIPSTQTLGNDYKIKIKSETYSSTYIATSDNNFAISGSSNLPSLRVISPNGGENWARGTTKLITWTKTGNPGTYIRIELFKGGLRDRIISSNTPNDGSFSWSIPWTQVIRSDYKIKITSTSNSAYNDWSNNNFRIY